MAIELVSLAPEDLEAVREELLNVYRMAFALPPYFEREEDVARFSESMSRHAQRDGFRCCIARERPGEQIVGFTYGYISKRGQWWHDQVATALSQKDIARWLDDAFEFVVIAVMPQAQGRGIGGKLHDAILAGLPQRTAILSANQAETNAMQLYRKRGWHLLLQDFFFTGGTTPMVVMGIDLSKSNVDA
jgi:ribosomal protein S18 acetylase RimI-like enzyme